MVTSPTLSGKEEGSSLEAQVDTKYSARPSDWLIIQPPGPSTYMSVLTTRWIKALNSDPHGIPTASPHT
jgi:hypothetical protein